MNVAILLDGLSDVVQIGYDSNSNGTPDSFDDLWTDTSERCDRGDELTGYEIVGGDVPSQRFLGNVIVTTPPSHGPTAASSAASSRKGSRSANASVPRSPATAVFVITGVTDDVLTVGAGGLTAGDYTGARISTLTRSGIWDGHATVQAPEQDPFLTWEGWTLVRQSGGWLADGFLEGQWVEICQGATCIRAKIQVIRGTNPTFDNELELRYTRTDGDLVAAFEDSLAGFGAGLCRSASPGSPRLPSSPTPTGTAADDQAGRRRQLRRADRT